MWPSWWVLAEPKTKRGGVKHQVLCFQCLACASPAPNLPYPCSWAPGPLV